MSSRNASYTGASAFKGMSNTCHLQVTHWAFSRLSFNYTPCACMLSLLTGLEGISESPNWMKLSWFSFLFLMLVISIEVSIIKIEVNQL